MTTLDTQRLKVLIAGIVSLVLMMGIARFAYTPLLPLMQNQTHLSLAMGGYLAAINYVGYLLGAILASIISDLRLKDTLFRAGLIIAVLTTIMMGLAENIWLWVISRFLAGLSSAAGLLIGSGLIMHWLIRHEFKSELGLHFSGVGLGIAFCALFVLIFEQTMNWQIQWYWLSLIGALLAAWAWLWLPRPGTANQTVSGQVFTDNPPGKLFLRLFMLAYFCAGVGYVVSATFIVSIVNELGFPGSLAFMLIGLGAVPAAIAWDMIARRINTLDALVLCYLINLFSNILLLISASLLTVAISSLLFGFSFVGIVSLVLTVAGRYYPTRPAKMMGKMTISYGIAQITAPFVIGLFAEQYGGYLFGLYFALAMIFMGAIIMFFIRKSG